MRLNLRVLVIAFCLFFSAFSKAGYSLLPPRPEERGAIKVADIANEETRLKALKEALKPYLYSAPAYGFRWTKQANYLAMTGHNLNSDTWKTMSEKLKMNAGFYVSQDPIDSAMYGSFFQIIKFPEGLELLSEHRMGIDYVNHGPGPVLIALGYASPDMTDIGYFQGRTKEELDKLHMFYTDLKKLSIVGSIYTDTWINIRRPVDGIEILSPESFMARAANDPNAQKWLQSIRFQKAQSHMENSKLSYLCSRIHAFN
jgi:hypothetical protein